MSSLLTNTSAMVALQTLRKINTDMGQVQNEISTGKRIANARDNAALWGISATMETDISGFKAISESLSLGTATLTVGRDAAETITSLLDQLKGRVVAAQEENVDRSKIQADVNALREQIVTVTNAAQFNGLNLLQGYDEVSILASLNRNDAGDVTTSEIKFRQADLSTKAGALGVVPPGTDLSANITAITSPNTGVANTATFQATTAVPGGASSIGRITIGGVDIVVDLPAGSTDIEMASAFAGAINANPQLKELGITASNGAPATDTVTVSSKNSFEDIAIGDASASPGGAFAATAGGPIEKRAGEAVFAAVPVAENDSYRITVGAQDYDYIAGPGETMEDVAIGLARLINSDPAAAKTNITAKAVTDSAPVKVLIDNGSGDATLTMAKDGATDGVRAGGLRGLEAIDVSTKEGAKAALASLEGFIQKAIEAAAAFGSAQGRIDTQTEFVSRIMDGLTSGVGALVDADMEAASARLQALQVQQQLGTQALSIANQQPQNILALFQQ